MKNRKLLITLFVQSLILSSSTFGGGYVIVSLMRKQYTEKLKLLTEEDMLDITAISQSAPGAVAVNAAILLGYRTAGIPGIAVCLLGTVLPPLVIVSLLAFLYGSIRENPVIDRIMTGMQAGASAVILRAAAGMTKTVFRTRRAIYIILFASILTIVLLFGVSPIHCIGAAAFLGLIDTRIWIRKERR